MNVLYPPGRGHKGNQFQSSPSRYCCVSVFAWNCYSAVSCYSVHLPHSFFLSLSCQMFYTWKTPASLFLCINNIHRKTHLFILFYFFCQQSCILIFWFLQFWDRTGHKSPSDYCPWQKVKLQGIIPPVNSSCKSCNLINTWFNLSLADMQGETLQRLKK